MFGVKAIIGGCLLVTGIILSFIPATSCIGITMLTKGFEYAISSMALEAGIAGLIAIIKGNDVWNTVLEGTVKGFYYIETRQKESVVFTTENVLLISKIL